MKRTSLFLVSISVIGLFVGAARADGPSYNETLAFLREKLNTRSNDGTMSRRLEEVSHCRFRYVVVNYAKAYEFKGRALPPNAPWFGYVDYFNAGDLDPSRVEVNGSSLKPFTLKGRRLVESRRVYYDLDKTVSEGWASHSDFVACDVGTCSKEAHYNMIIDISGVLSPASDNGPRAKRALEHLIRLCGGKEELF